MLSATEHSQLILMSVDVWILGCCRSRPSSREEDAFNRKSGIGEDAGQGNVQTAGTCVSLMSLP